MTVRALPNLGLRAFYNLGEDGWKDDMDLGLLKLSVLTQGRVLSKVAALPGGAVLGDVYLCSETHPTNPNQIAVYDGEPGALAWVYIVPKSGWLVYNVAAGYYESFSGAVWAQFAGGGGGGPGDAPTESIIVALGDEVTPVVAGNGKVTIRMPYAFTLTAIKASLTVASSAGLVTVDVNEGSASILSTKLSLDATEKTSTTAATPAVISDAALAADAEITFDIDAAGNGAAGLKVYLIGHQ